MKAIAVSIRADKQFIKALKVVAARHGVVVADLVRNALDAQHNGEIQEQLSFFASNDYKNSQLTEKDSEVA